MQHDAKNVNPHEFPLTLLLNSDRNKNGCSYLGQTPHINNHFVTLDYIDSTSDRTGERMTQRENRERKKEAKA